MTTQQKFFSEYKKRIAHGEELKRLTSELEETKQKLEKLSKERKDEKSGWEKEKTKLAQEKRKLEIGKARWFCKMN